MKRVNNWMPRAKQKPQIATRFDYHESEVRKARLDGAKITYKNDLKWMYPAVAMAMHEDGMDEEKITNVLGRTMEIIANFGQIAGDKTMEELCFEKTGLKFELDWDDEL